MAFLTNCCRDSNWRNLDSLISESMLQSLTHFEASETNSSSSGVRGFLSAVSPVLMEMKETKEFKNPDSTLMAGEASSCKNKNL